MSTPRREGWGAQGRASGRSEKADRQRGRRAVPEAPGAGDGWRTDAQRRPVMTVGAGGNGCAQAGAGEDRREQARTGERGRDQGNPARSEEAGAGGNADLAEPAVLARMPGAQSARLVAQVAGHQVVQQVARRLVRQQEQGGIGSLRLKQQQAGVLGAAKAPTGPARAQGKAQVAQILLAQGREGSKPGHGIGSGVSIIEHDVSSNILLGMVCVKHVRARTAGPPGKI